MRALLVDKIESDHGAAHPGTNCNRPTARVFLHEGPRLAQVVYGRRPLSKPPHRLVTNLSAAHPGPFCFVHEAETSLASFFDSASDPAFQLPPIRFLNGPRIRPAPHRPKCLSVDCPGGETSRRSSESELPSAPLSRKWVILGLSALCWACRPPKPPESRHLEDCGPCPQKRPTKRRESNIGSTAG